MKPANVRLRILEDHEQLRDLLSGLEEVAHEVAAGDWDRVPELRTSALVIDDALRRHLALEDRRLAPLVRAGLGEDAREALDQEHAEQRALLEYVLSRLQDERRPALLLARELLTLGEVLLEDMLGEEQSLLSNPDLWEDGGSRPGERCG